MTEASFTLTFALSLPIYEEKRGSRANDHHFGGLDEGGDGFAGLE
jgi:hypothetical protein